VIRDLDANDACHSLPLLLRVTWVLLADDPDNTFAADDLAFCTTNFDGSPDFHSGALRLLVTINDSTPRQVVGGQF
jgi:hypothetical protein